jgi:uncharacterized protein YacL
MAIGVVVLLIAVLIIAILTLLRFKKLKHEIFAFFLIILMLFAFFSFSMAFKGESITISNFSDVSRAAQIYLSWFGNAFDNMKIITTQAIKMDWETNKTA